MTAHTDAAVFDEILDHLRQTRGFDFTAYKRTSLVRRVLKRMQTIEIDSFERYLDYLQLHPEEFSDLFNTILINVTSFFRDEEVWQYLQREIIPRLVAGRDPGAHLRVWSAGCASGQEAYSVAMLLAEHLAAEALRDHVKIYATDVDEEALAEARLAKYAARHVEDIPPHLLAKYFEKNGDSYVLNRDVRRSVIFGRNDLLQDAPISRVDLLLCRNTLMYLNSEARGRILSRLYFSVTPQGFLVLGRAEMLFSHGAMFAPVDLKRRVFRSVPKSSQRDRLLILAQTGRDAMAKDSPEHVRLRDAAFESDTLAHVVLDTAGHLVAMNAPAREQFGLSTSDIGHALQDLDVSYRPVDLRSALGRALQEGREVRLKDVSWMTGGEHRAYDVVVCPLFDEDRSLLGSRISFVDVTQYKSLEQQLQHSKQELETAYEELQSTNEELETTNEELQSTVEELETTNEELQSTNEELETMNEELQSTNEELQTINDELRNRGTDLNAANSFLESVFTSLRSAVVVLDREFRIQVWNDRAEDLWGVRSNEAHQTHFLALDIGLPVGSLRQPIRDILAATADHVEVVLPATSRRGKPIECRVSLTPLRHHDRAITGAILLMEEKQVQV